MVHSLSISPLDKEKKPTLLTPTDSLSFHKHQIIQDVLKKKYKVVLKDFQSTRGWLEFVITDGLYRVHYVQCFKVKVGKTHRTVFQCSCKQFCDDEANYCEHIAVIDVALSNPALYERGFSFEREVASQFRSFSTLPFAMKIYDSNEKRAIKVSRGTQRQTEELLATQDYTDSVSLYQYREKMNLDLLIANTSNKVAEKIHSTGLLLNDVSLYSYQEKIFSGMVKEKKAICSMKMGSGKTITTIACFGWLRKHYKADLRALVICPKSLKLQWQAELKRVLDVDAMTIDTAKDMDKIGSSAVDIVTYQLFSRLDESFLNKEYDFVVMDEIQFIRNEESKVWKSARKLECEFFYGLSGTVIENKLDDLYAIMEVVDPGLLGPKWKFSQEFQNLVSVTKKTIVFRGIKNHQALKKKIEHKVFSYEDLKLPDITHNFIAVGMSHKQREEHDYNHGEAQKLLAKGMTSGLSFVEKNILQSYLLKARQACNSESLLTKRPSMASPKMIELIKVIKQEISNGNGKIVLFSQWTEMLDLIEQELRAARIGYVFYTGRESEKARAKSITAFSTDPGVQVFLASDSGGVGVDGLQLVSNVVIHVELPWNPAKLDQRSGRVHRLGQTKPVTVYYLYATDSIEDNMRSVLTDKRGLRQTILEDAIRDKMLSKES